jgi:fibronectin type 3 domain-containing protein
MIVGCTNQPKLKSNPNLPTVSKVDYRKDRNQVVIYWNRIDDNLVKGYYLTRSDDEKKYNLVATINDTDITYFNDKGLTPRSKYSYKIATFDKNGVPSKGLKLEVYTRPNIKSVVGLKNEQLKKQGKIKFSFRPHNNERVSGYLVQKYDGKEFKTVAKLDSRFSVEFLDKELKDGKSYEYRVIAITFDGLQAAPSEVLKIKTLGKPSIIMGLKASSNIPKKIEISWNSSTNIDNYEVYSSDELNGDYKLIAKTKNSNYTHNLNRDGVIKYYKVVAVDNYGLKSLMQKNGEMGSTVSIPASPEITKDSSLVKFTISSPDGRAVKYEVEREGNNLVKKFLNVQSPFEDNTIETNSTKSYVYKFYAIDKDDLKSNPTEFEVNR